MPQCTHLSLHICHDVAGTPSSISPVITRLASMVLTTLSPSEILQMKINEALR